jgi:hypothetical protein
MANFNRLGFAATQNDYQQLGTIRDNSERFGAARDDLDRFILSNAERDDVTPR